MSEPAYQALLEAQRSGDPHREALALRAVARLDYRPIHGRGRSDLDRFWTRLVFGMSDCWIWLGGLSHLGYGVTGARIQGERTAHRASYRLFNGKIPIGLHVMHSCDVRCCVNPEHLSLGTHLENMRDMAAKGRGRAPMLMGERNPMARLSATQVAEIRRLKGEGVSQLRLARLLGVSPMTISRIIRGETWK
jgi:hypothetical protein